MLIRFLILVICALNFSHATEFTEEDLHKDHEWKTIRHLAQTDPAALRKNSDWRTKYVQALTRGYYPLQGSNYQEFVIPASHINPNKIKSPLEFYSLLFAVKNKTIDLFPLGLIRGNLDDPICLYSVLLSH